MKLAIFLASLLSAAPLVAQPSAEPTVVFVCEQGAAKSVIATSYFNKLARERGLPDRATEATVVCWR